MPWIQAARSHDKSRYQFPIVVVFDDEDCARAEAWRKELILHHELMLEYQKEAGAARNADLARYFSGEAKHTLTRIKALEYVMHWHIRDMAAVEMNPTLAPMADEMFGALETKCWKQAA